MNTSLETPNSALDQSEGEDEISLLDLGIVLAQNKKTLMRFPAIVALVSAVVVLLLPNIYTATTKILPPQQSQSGAAAMLAQLGGLASIAGGAAGIKNPADMYVGMLKSRTVADKLIERFNLNSVYDNKYQSNTRKKLEAMTTITAGKDGFITVEFDDKDPKQAADIANAYVEELFQITKTLAVTEAGQRRLFFEKQLEQARENLINAETAARSAIGKGGLIKVDDQGRVLVETMARLRAQITAKEVQIGSMRSFASKQNPQLVSAEQELAVLKQELAKIEGDTPQALPATADSSSEGLKNLGLLRDMKYNETVYELMAKQYELAKIDEAKDPSVIQVVDRAIEPDRKSKPKRSLIVLMATLAAFFFAVIWVFVRNAYQKSSADQLARIGELRNSLRWRRV